MSTSRISRRHASKSSTIISPTPVGLFSHPQPYEKPSSKKHSSRTKHTKSSSSTSELLSHSSLVSSSKPSSKKHSSRTKHTKSSSSTSKLPSHTNLVSSSPAELHSRSFSALTAQDSAKLLHAHIVNNEVRKAERMLRKNPELLLIQLNHRMSEKRVGHYDGDSAFQVALREGNIRMCYIIEYYFSRLENGNIEKAQQVIRLSIDNSTLSPEMSSYLDHLHSESSRVLKIRDEQQAIKYEFIDSLSHSHSDEPMRVRFAKYLDEQFKEEQTKRKVSYDRLYNLFELKVEHHKKLKALGHDLHSESAPARIITDEHVPSSPKVS